MLRRRYIATADVQDATDDQVALAEALIDAYVGHQNKFINSEIAGKVTASLTGKVVDTRGDSPLFVTDNTYSYCIIEIIGGPGAGQSRYITASNKDERSLSFSGDPFNPGLDDTSVYRVYQLAKFPRRQDSRSIPSDEAFYKYIPDAIKNAAIAETQFVMAQGDDYFTSDDSEMNSESLLNYSYSRGGNAGQSALVKFMSPQARAYLKGYKNSTGQIAVDHP